MAATIAARMESAVDRMEEFWTVLWNLESRIDRQEFHSIDRRFIAGTGDKHRFGTFLQDHRGIGAGPDPCGLGAAVGIDPVRVICQELAKGLVFCEFIHVSLWR